MEITVKLFAGLRKNRFKSRVLSVPAKSTINSLFKELKFNEDEVAVIFVNNCHADVETIINKGDIVALFPPAGGG